MAMIRFSLDLAIPFKVYDAVPTAKKTAFRDAVRAIKALAAKINEGKENEEMTVKAVWHKCYHDEDPTKPCGPEQEI